MKKQPANITKQISANPAPPRILIVDDEHDFALLMERMVTDLGYRAARAGSAAEALAALAIEPADLVLTDRLMTGMDGMELLRAIRSAYPTTDVIVMTGHRELDTYMNVIRAGGVDFIEKPVRLEDVRAKLASVFRERALTRHSRGDIENWCRTQEETIQEDLELQTVLARLLQLALSEQSISAMLDQFVEHITALPWLDLQPKGCVFLVETPGFLTMKAQRNLAPPLHHLCARIPFGHCLCGRAARDRAIIFAADLDERHDVTFSGITPHGHYCIPILAGNCEVLGVFTVYTEPGAMPDSRVEATLTAAAATLAGILLHQRSLQAQLESEERCRIITEAAAEAMIIINDQGRIVFWNPGARRIFGHETEEALGQVAHVLLAPRRYHATYQARAAHYAATGQPSLGGRTMELNALHKEGHEFPIELSLSPLKHLEKWHTLAVIRDISERKREEARRKEVENQLMQAQKMDAIGTLAGGIAHDFNNILAAIIGFASMAQDDLPPEAGQIHDDLGQILSAAGRARDLVAQILTFSRQKGGTPAPLELDLIVKEALKLLRATIPTNFAIKQEIQSQCGIALADPTHIHQVVVNLCTNAYHAMRAQGRGTIRISLRPVELDEEAAAAIGEITAGPYIRLTVSDNGCGMCQTTMSRIFEPFFTTKQVGEGTGLGLAVVHGIVKTLAGAIKVESTIGLGTTFDLYFPIVAALTRNIPTPAGEIQPGKGEHLLVVDDEEDLVVLESRLLEKMGYRVTPFSSSQAALDQFRQTPAAFAAILTDQAMPAVSGIDLARAMLAIRPDIPIVLITGFSETVTPETAREIGIRAMLLKPICREDLSRVLRRVIEGNDHWGQQR